MEFFGCPYVISQLFSEIELSLAYQVGRDPTKARVELSSKMTA